MHYHSQKSSEHPFAAGIIIIVISLSPLPSPADFDAWFEPRERRSYSSCPSSDASDAPSFLPPLKWQSLLADPLHPKPPSHPRSARDCAPPSVCRPSRMMVDVPTYVLSSPLLSRPKK